MTNNPHTAVEALETAIAVLRRKLPELDVAAIPTKSEVFVVAGSGARKMHDAIETVLASLASNKQEAGEGELREADRNAVEPKGCPTPGACSCPVALSDDERLAIVASIIEDAMDSAIPEPWEVARHAAERIWAYARASFEVRATPPGETPPMSEEWDGEDIPGEARSLLVAEFPSNDPMDDASQVAAGAIRALEKLLTRHLAALKPTLPPHSDGIREEIARLRVALQEIEAQDDPDLTETDLRQHDRSSGIAFGIRVCADIARTILSRTTDAVAAEREEWKPIETAPKDKPVWIYLKSLSWRGLGGMAVGYLHSDYNGHKDVWTLDGRCGTICRPEPTHWRDFPTPPAIRGGDVHG